MKIEVKCKKGEQITRLQIIAELMRNFPEEVFEIRQKDEMKDSMLKNEVSYLTKDIEIVMDIKF